MHSIILLSTKFDDVKKKDDGIYIYKAINKEFLLIIVFLFGLLVFLSLSKKKKGKEIIILSPLGFIDLLLLTFAMVAVHSLTSGFFLVTSIALVN